MITLHTRLCIWCHVTWCTNWSMDFTKRRNEKQQLANVAMKHSLYWNMLSHIQLDPHRSLTLHSCHCERMSFYTAKLVQTKDASSFLFLLIRSICLILLQAGIRRKSDLAASSSIVTVHPFFDGYFYKAR